MKKVFKLEGLNCAHCASKIEEKVGKLEGVKSVMVNFMTTKMTLESENMEEVVEKVKKLVNEVEPDVNMVKHSQILIEWSVYYEKKERNNYCYFCYTVYFNSIYKNASSTTTYTNTCSLCFSGKRYSLTCC